MATSDTRRLSTRFAATVTSRSERTRVRGAGRRFRADGGGVICRLWWVGSFVLGVCVVAFADDAANNTLWAAARKGDASAVKAALDAGVSVNAKTTYGATALSFAADKGQLEVVRLLLERGAEVNVKDGFYQAIPLTWAAEHDHWEIVSRLLRRGAEGGEELLSQAVGGGNTDAVRAILGGAKFAPETLTSALTQAEVGGRPEIAELLRSAGATETKVEVAAKLAPQTLRRYAGTYKNAQLPMEITFTMGNENLGGTVPGRPTITDALSDQSTFQSVEVPGIKVTFHTVGNKVPTMTVAQGGGKFVFEHVEPAAAQTVKTATPAISNGTIIVRTARHIFGIRDAQTPTARGSQ